MAEKIKAAILASGMTHYSLGKLAGVSPTVIDRFAAGKRDLRLTTADKLARVLGLELQQRMK